MKIYLAGGMHSGWQDDVIARYPDIEFLDPRSHGLTDVREYTREDMNMIKKCDAIIAYLEKDNPGGFQMAFEIGYFVGLHDPHTCLVYFVDEKQRYTGMLRVQSSLTFDSMAQLYRHIDIVRETVWRESV